MVLRGCCPMDSGFVLREPRNDGCSDSLPNTRTLLKMAASGHIQFPPVPAIASVVIKL
jgi:hypothetical protein